MVSDSSVTSFVSAHGLPQAGQCAEEEAGCGGGDTVGGGRAPVWLRLFCFLRLLVFMCSVKCG